jgi:hypothetical protein
VFLLGGLKMQLEVKIAIQVQDDCETWCADCYWLDIGGWCRLFEMNTCNKYPGDGTQEKHERCSECLMSEFEPCKCHDPECDVFDIITKGKPCNCYLKYKEEVELQAAVLNPGEGINEQDQDGHTVCVLRKDRWEIRPYPDPKKELLGTPNEIYADFNGYWSEMSCRSDDKYKNQRYIRYDIYEADTKDLKARLKRVLEITYPMADDHGKTAIRRIMIELGL